MVSKNDKLSKILDTLPTVEHVKNSAEISKEQTTGPPRWPLILVPSENGIVSKPLMSSTPEEFFAWAKTLGYASIDTGQILTPPDLRNMFDQIVYIATIRLFGTERDSRVGHA